MNIDENLLLLKGEDKTESVKHCQMKNGKYQVVFNDSKVYTYNPSNVEWLKNPVPYDATTTVVYKNHLPLSGIKKIIHFKKYIRLGFGNGYMKVYPSRELTLEESCLKNPKAKSTFTYLSDLAKIRRINDEEQTYLSKQYEEMTCISSSSILSSYLNPTANEKSSDKKISENHVPIFPFGFNLSQKEATEIAIAEQLSLIEGPPGTGKTQTILNIIVNAIINGQTVAVVSNNNAATANVLEKLQKYDLSFLVAFLGNRSNKEKFFTEQTSTYPNMTSWVLETKDYAAHFKALREAGKKLNELLEVQNKIALSKQELATLSLEKEYFNTYYKETSSDIKPYHSIYHHNSDKIISFWQDIQQEMEQRGTVSLLSKIKYLLFYGITSFSFYINSSDQIISFLQKLSYERKEEELNTRIALLSKHLENYHFQDQMKEYRQSSMTLLKANLAQRYLPQKNRKIFGSEALWKGQEFGIFIKEYPVVLSTTHSLRMCIPSNYLFDYVIIDEASQVDIVTGALALSCAKKAVMVGDLHQLPNVVPADLAEKTKRIFQQYSLPPAYNYAENNILSSIASLFKMIPKTMLREHYRCHPKIIGFCNEKFYNDDLIILTEEKECDVPLVVYKTAPGNHARGRYNQRQIDVILHEILPQQNLSEGGQSVGIISPFRLQAEKLAGAVGDQSIEVDTVHKYQGRERDVVILTTVVNEITDFVDNPNLINVAISRAVNKLIVITSDYNQSCSSNLNDLIKYIQYNNFEVQNSEIYSVFDLLYRRYSTRLLSIKKNRKNISAYESENLMNSVIENVLCQPAYQNLGHVMHQPLRMLIRDTGKLDDAECRFTMNILTHTDFVIFNKLDKQPVLVVEVDGYQYHDNNPKQLARDRMKDNILAKYSIPILRLKTVESREEERLREKLNQVLNITG